jgi:ribosome-associated protein
MRHLQFRLRDEFIGLDALLKVTGICSSGGAAKALVATGAVEVDGSVELRKTCKIRAGRTVVVGDARIEVVGAAPVR